MFQCLLWNSVQPRYQWSVNNYTLRLVSLFSFPCYCLILIKKFIYLSIGERSKAIVCF